MRKKPVPKDRRDFTSRRLRQKRKEVHTVLAREEQVLQHGDGPKFRSIRKRAQRIHGTSDPRVEAVRNTRNLIDVC